MLEKSIENQISSKGLLNVDVSISADIFTIQMEIDAIYVDLCNLVIRGDEEHIDIRNEIVEVIVSFVDIEKEKVIFSE